MIACNKPFEEDDPVAFEAFCHVLSQELSGSEFYQNYEKMYQEALIRQLIEGSVKDKNTMPPA